METRIGIGIDTGGTYTDAVAYDFAAKKVLASAKALTTKDDLSRGILEAFDALRLGEEIKPQAIALSTTLATNACVENKLGRAKLVFFGGNAKTVDGYGREFGLPPSSEMFLHPCSTSYERGGLEDVDWDHFVQAVLPALREVDGVGVIETYSMRNGAAIERRAKHLIEAQCTAPVVCGYELVTELNCLQRGASTLLNASLFPIIHTFITAIKTAMAQRNVVAPIMIVRSDGSLMNEAFTALRPVETLLCGPAASVLGSVELADEKNCLVVDMGGTTTDIAMVVDGKPVRAENGISAGGWKTFIKGLRIHTFGLGGDTAIHHRAGELVLEQYRVVPLCIAAATAPNIVPFLGNLVKEGVHHTRPIHEFCLLMRNIEGSARFTDEEKAICAFLANGPQDVRTTAAAIGKDEYRLDMTRLIREGVVQMCGLTPTDIMHVMGEFDRYNVEASRLGAEYIAENCGISLDEMCAQVNQAVRKRLYTNIVTFLMESQHPHYRKNGIPEEITRLIEETFFRLEAGQAPLLQTNFTTTLSLVGIGAPIHLYLNDVAKLLGTRAVIPQHAPVANALGAVVGGIHVEYECEVRPIYTMDGISGYTVYTQSATREFKQYDEAEAFAREEAAREARAEALRRGAVGDIPVHFDVVSHDGEAREVEIYLGTNVIARAIGSISL